MSTHRFPALRNALTRGQRTLAAPVAEHGPEMLFVQTYQSGTITPVEGTDGRYTLTLEAGTGQTVYFSDRPDRIVGSEPTPQLLGTLGFSSENPPNAALVVETAPGESDVAVVELFSPLYDPETQGVTFEIQVLANWQQELQLDFVEAPIDLSALAPSFGSAHLFIDDCDLEVMFCVPKECTHNDPRRQETRSDPACASFGVIPALEYDGYCYSWANGTCLPCSPWFGTCDDTFDYFTNFCNERYPDCAGNCKPLKVTSGSVALYGCGEGYRH